MGQLAQHCQISLQLQAVLDTQKNKNGRVTPSVEIGRTLLNTDYA
jgi:hypothetical protein